MKLSYHLLLFGRQAETSECSAANPKCTCLTLLCCSQPHANICCPGLIHPGLIGTAPSKELLDIWNTRERALVEAGPEGTTLGGVLHTRPLGEWAAANLLQLVTV